MKYIDADRLLAEIERRKKSLRAGICNEEVFTRKQRKEMLVASEELDRLNRFLSTLEEKLEKQIIPSNSNEAAEEYVVKAGLQSEAFIAIPSFKAGVEWMAEQGVSMEYEVEDKCLELSYGSLPGLDPIITLPDSFQIGDKVILQIRKK